MSEALSETLPLIDLGLMLVYTLAALCALCAGAHLASVIITELFKHMED